jgi:regulation of enolase protein 1 (concanavalin A-like superfamily)
MNLSDLTWTNPPAAHEALPGGGLRLTTAAGGDYWRRTFYGYTHTSGHLLAAPVTGDFSAEVTVTASYDALYDQAGLMLWVDDETWVKAGVEMTDGAAYFSVVMTRGMSDWSTMLLPFAASPLRLRLTRHDDAIRVQLRTPAGAWQLARLGALSEAPGRVGPMACSPTRSGFVATFTDFTLGAAIDRALHA